MRIWASLLLLLFGSPAPAEASLKHFYCVRIVEAGFRNVRCEGCWTWVGGEGGRVACTLKYGGGQVNVHYGKCEEQRNTSLCRY
jgi:hypothetical protein